MKFIKRTAAAVIAAALIISLAACGAQSGTSDNDTGTTSSAAVSATVTPSVSAPETSETESTSTSDSSAELEQIKKDADQASELIMGAIDTYNMYYKKDKSEEERIKGEKTYNGQSIVLATVADVYAENGIELTQDMLSKTIDGTKYTICFGKMNETDKASVFVAAEEEMSNASSAYNVRANGTIGEIARTLDILDIHFDD